MIGTKREHGGRRFAVRLLLKLAVMGIIFVAGGISGALWGINYTFSQLKYHAEHMAELPDTVVPRLADELSLTEDQRPDFDRIFRKYHAKITEAEGKNAMKVHQYFYAMGKDILTVLDAEQAEEFREFHRKICTVFLPPIPQGMKVDGETPHHPCVDL